MKNSSTKKIYRFFSFLFSYLIIFSFPASVLCGLQPENLAYKVNYLWFWPIGKIEVSATPYVLDQKDIYQVSVTYQSPRWLSLLFNSNGKINSYFDTKTFLPLRYEEFYSYTLGDPVNTVLVYDQEKKRVYIDRNGEKETREIFENTVDPLSALFLLRFYPWKEGEEKSLNLNNHQNNYALSVRCLSTGVVKKIQTWQFEGTIKRYDPEEEVLLKFEGWLSKDLLRIPLKLVFHSKLGRFSLRLKQ